MNHSQWVLLDTALADPSIKKLLVSSEIPFAGDEPETVKKHATKAGLEFLVDHWPYNDLELVKLLERVFDWKHAGNGERDALFVAGDIHAGVDSIITDNTTGATIQQIVATPISNHVCDFFPKLEGKVNDRFSYVHTPLKFCRNYGYINVQDGKISAKLIAGEPTHTTHK